MRPFFRPSLALLFVFAATGILARPVQASLNTDLDRITHASGTPQKKLERLYDLYWQHQMEVSPESATYVGVPGHNDRWSDASPARILAMHQEHKDFLAAALKISSNNLTGEAQISYLLFKSNLELAIEGDAYPDEYLQIDPMGGPHTQIVDILTMAPRASEKDYRDRIVRLRTFPKPLEQVLELLKTGLQKGITSPQFTLRDVPAQFDSLLKEPIEENPLFESFKTLPKDLSVSVKTDIQNQAKAAIREVAIPGLKKLHDFLVTTYIPGARKTISFSDLPDGKRWYEYEVKVQTTTRLTPADIHEIGLREVTRIRAGMDKIREEIKFKGDFAAFNKHLREDPAFFYTNETDLLAGYRDIAKRIDAELPRLFGHLPRLTYGVRAMPAFKAKSSPAAYYEGGSLESGRAGYFTANTYDLKSRPKWQMETLTLHEAVPGHHLQIALAQELTDLPKFRKEGGYTAFIEGWGLYAEGLGQEIGLYQDANSLYGRYNFEMMRAIRLVVDTGLHSQHWTRDQVVDYFRANSAVSEQEIQAETDRYIVMPAQALAYKVGEMKFKDLRDRARAKLGPKFSIREFHDQLLGSGALPMDVVETKMTNWMIKRSVN